MPVFDDGTILIGKEHRKSKRFGSYTTWSDFGGGQDRGETHDKTALREFNEETARSFPGVSLSQVQSSSYSDQPNGNGFYRMHLVEVHGKKPTIADIHKNARSVRKKLGHKAHVEKIDWKYVTPQQLLGMVYHRNKVPGTSETLFGPTVGSFKKLYSQYRVQTTLNFAMRKATQPKIVPVRTQKLIPKKVAVKKSNKKAVKHKKTKAFKVQKKQQAKRQKKSIKAQKKQQAKQQKKSIKAQKKQQTKRQKQRVKVQKKRVKLLKKKRKVTKHKKK